MLKKLFDKLRSNMLWGQNYQDKFIPATEDIFVGGKDRDNYRLIGIYYLKQFISLCGLQRDWKVLDVGCGSGRLTVPLALYLRKGSYYGIDIVPAGINWCLEKIKPHFPNVNFELADVHNAHYNPNGNEYADKYSFPYADNTFDLIFLTSVFTHMKTSDVENYTSEIHRVLKPKGRCLITFFIFDEDSAEGIRQKKSRELFTHDCGQYLAANSESHELAIAYRIEYLEDLFRRNNLSIQLIKKGGWRWRKDGPPGHTQDKIIVVK